jgi:diguanylate cyclase (GGDEF)-like protein
MTEEFGDARLRELAFLSKLDRDGGMFLSQPPGRMREMIASLIQSEFVNDVSVSTGQANLLQPGLWAFKGRIELDKLRSLNQVLAGQEVHIQIGHRGRVRLSELRQELQRNRIREGFGIIWDKRHFDTDLRIALLQASNTRSVSLAFVDMNGLKSFNTNFGHSAGDEAIKVYFRVAETILGSRGDVYCKGGDEVAAILSGADSALACNLVRAMHAALAAEHVRIGEKEWTGLTASAGIATTTNPTTDVQALLDRAESAMRGAKEHVRRQDPRPSSIAVDGENEVLTVVPPR